MKLIKRTNFQLHRYLDSNLSELDLCHRVLCHPRQYSWRYAIQLVAMPIRPQDKRGGYYNHQIPLPREDEISTITKIRSPRHYQGGFDNYQSPMIPANSVLPHAYSPREFPVFPRLAAYSNNTLVHSQECDKSSQTRTASTPPHS